MRLTLSANSLNTQRAGSSLVFPEENRSRFLRFVWASDYFTGTTGRARGLRRRKTGTFVPAPPPPQEEARNLSK